MEKQKICLLYSASTNLFSLTQIKIKFLINLSKLLKSFKHELPFSEKFLFCSKVQNVEAKLNQCLHHDVITLSERGNSDPGKPTFSGVSEGNTTIVSLSLQGNIE